jgi:uncharacterized protein YxjI
MFSWFDSYDIYNEAENKAFTVKGALAWGHLLKIYDVNGRELGRVKEKVFTFLPRFDIYKDSNLVGTISKKFSWWRPEFSLDFNGWTVVGDWCEWDYEVRDSDGGLVATVSKKFWKLTDTYEIDVFDDKNTLDVLMLVLAIDAEKDTREKISIET